MASQSNNSGQSAAYVFERAGSVWTEQAKLVTADGTRSDLFGSAVALSGGTAVVGAFERVSVQGAAFVFDVSGGGGPPPGWCLPTKVKAKVDAKHAEKSTLTASGTLDTGTGVPDFSGAATLDVGEFRLSIPALVAKGRSLSYGAGGVTLTITPARNGSSRAKFSVKAVGDLRGRVGLDAPLGFNFTNAAHNLSGTATLAAGKLGVHGVTAPNLWVRGAAASINGGGMDSIEMTLGFATDGVVPAAAEAVTIGFGDTYAAPLPTNSFVRKGSTYVHTARAPGITKAVVDYAKGTITVAGTRLDLGAFAAGGNAVVATITRGGDTRTGRVRMSLAGTKLTY